jgi:hypothetical protein
VARATARTKQAALVVKEGDGSGVANQRASIALLGLINLELPAPGKRQEGVNGQDAIKSYRRYLWVALAAKTAMQRNPAKSLEEYSDSDLLYVSI